MYQEKWHNSGNKIICQIGYPLKVLLNLISKFIQVEEIQQNFKTFYPGSNKFIFSLFDYSVTSDNRFNMNFIYNELVIVALVYPLAALPMFKPNIPIF